MRNKLHATDCKVFAWALILWAFCLTGVVAQEAVEADEPLTRSDATTVGDLEKADATDTPSPNTSGKVLDYKPTESISEDLSVSFPVDI